jgi:uncharacterized membrane protein YbaN (DUF454 family)
METPSRQIDVRRCHVRLIKPLLIVTGSVCVVLGVVGIFVPLLPTTPFLLAAAICYAKSSPKLLHWLLHNRWFGSYIRNYREGRGIPRREKLFTIALLWLTIGLSVIFFIPGWDWGAGGLLWAKLLLIGIALAVTVHLLRVKTFDPARHRNGPLQSAEPKSPRQS